MWALARRKWGVSFISLFHTSHAGACRLPSHPTAWWPPLLNLSMCEWLAPWFHPFFTATNLNNFLGLIFFLSPSSPPCLWLVHVNGHEIIADWVPLHPFPVCARLPRSGVISSESRMERALEYPYMTSSLCHSKWFSFWLIVMRENNI